MKKIAIIGAGNIGRRYLESFSLAKDVYDIYVMDVSEDALCRIKDMTDNLNMKHIFHYLKRLEDLPKEIDLGAITTTSKMRREIVVNLLNNTSVKYLILEKFLFDKLHDYDVVENLIEKKHIKAWVNCGRRAQQSYIWLKKEIEKANHCEIYVSGGEWGLGCNAVHYLDLIAYLAGTDKMDISLCGLDSIICDSKRKSYKEIFGTISGSMGKCRNFSISSYYKSRMPVFVTILTEKAYYRIDESGQCINIISENGDNLTKKFPLKYTSQMMESIIHEIIETGECVLAQYSESSEIHRLLQVPLTKFFEDQGFENGVCPIT